MTRIMMGRLTLGHADPLLRLIQACSSSAQIKTAVVHMRRLKQDWRKKKLSMTISEVLGVAEVEDSQTALVPRTVS